jgi:predicted DNA-binding protein (MmcQ/YjbR family)
MIRTDPTRYFKPPYVGPSGWVGIYLDGKVDWAAVEDQLRDAYRLIAPKKLLAEPPAPAGKRPPAHARKTAAKKK